MSEDEHVIHDPSNYRKMSAPFDSLADANAALVAFFKDVAELRQKHRISDVLVLCEISHMIGNEEVRGSASTSLGSSDRVLSIIAREHGRQSQIHEDRLALLMASERKRVRKARP